MQTLIPATGKHRNRSLDFLRGLAILLVLGRHSAIHAHDAGIFLPLAGVWQRIGWTGVDLFFVLSGFLVGGLLFSELKEDGTINIKRFIVRRCFKIWPTYYLYLAWLLALALLAGNSFTHAGATLLPSLLNVQNYTEPPRSHLWSLAVEEHFYLVLPVLLLWLFGASRGKRGGQRWFPVVVAIACAICLMARIWTAEAGPFSFQRNVYPTHLRIDALLFGVLLAYAFQFHPAIVAWAARRPGMLVLFGVSAVASMTLSTLERSPAIYTIGFSALYLGYGAVLFAFAAVPDASVISRIVRTRFASMICWIGIISYPMYLWHLDLAVQPIEWLLARRPIAEMNPSVRWAALTLLYVLLAVGAGWISCILVERPLLAIRDRYFPARARRPRMTDAAVSQPSRQRPSPALVSAPEPI